MEIDFNRKNSPKYEILEKNSIRVKNYIEQEEKES
jgi:hypothetical protein